MIMFDDMSFRVESVTRDCEYDRRIFDDLMSEADEVVIFGSRAAGVHSSSSDLDLLIITPKRRRLVAAGLDCVLLTPEEVNDSFWLGSELASHVAAYGRWAKGAGEWRSNVQLSDRAITRKRKRVSSVLRNVAQRWSRLHPIFQLKYRTTLRRELQRLKLLEVGFPIPPTPMLDSEWQFECRSGNELLQLALNVDLPKQPHPEIDLLLKRSLLSI